MSYSPFELQEEYNMLKISSNENRVTRSFTLKPSNIKLVEDLAEMHSSNASRVIEALIELYGPKIKAQMEERK
jgi:hypothetical protein